MFPLSKPGNTPEEPGTGAAEASSLLLLSFAAWQQGLLREAAARRKTKQKVTMYPTAHPAAQKPGPGYIISPKTPQDLQESLRRKAWNCA